MDTTSKALNAASWIGTILFVLDWIDVVPNRVGWIGFIIAVTALIAQLALRKRPH